MPILAQMSAIDTELAGRDATRPDASYQVARRPGDREGTLPEPGRGTRTAWIFAWPAMGERSAGQEPYPLGSNLSGIDKCAR